MSYDYDYQVVDGGGLNSLVVDTIAAYPFLWPVTLHQPTVSCKYHLTRITSTSTNRRCASSVRCLSQVGDVLKKC